MGRWGRFRVRFRVQVSLSLSLSLTHSLTHSPTLSHTLTHSLTHTHTHAHSQEAYPWLLAVTDMIAAVLYLFAGLCVLTWVKQILHWQTYLPARNPASQEPTRLQELHARVRELKKNA